MFEDLGKYEKQIYSQLGQDGVLARIFELIGTTNKFCVEFGARDGIELSNTANLRLNHGWDGLLMDGNPMAPHVKGEFITAENIEELFAKYNVPREFDYLSIDIDGNDYWIWKAITNYRPRVVTVEYNSQFWPHECKTIPYKPDQAWDHRSTYYGASIGALAKLGQQKGYSLVHQVLRLDAFFVLSDLLPPEDRNIPVDQIFPYPVAAHPPDLLNRPWIDV